LTPVGNIRSDALTANIIRLPCQNSGNIAHAASNSEKDTEISNPIVLVIFNNHQTDDTSDGLECYPRGAQMCLVGEPGNGQRIRDAGNVRRCAE